MNEADPPMPPPDEPAPAPAGALNAWLVQGMRSALFARPDWRGLHATPAVLAWLVGAGLLLAVVVERLVIAGPARFYWPALLAGWMPTVVIAWVCWLLVPHDDGGDDTRAPSAMALFALQTAQAVALWLMLGFGLMLLGQLGWRATEATGWGAWLAWAAPLAWGLCAMAVLLWRGGRRSPASRAQAIVLACAVCLLNAWSDPLRLWYPDETASAAKGDGPMQLTQEAFEDQAATLERRLDAIAAQRPGVVDVYALTFAPYADEDVFLRESRMVAAVMAQRFDAEGRTLQLVNHRGTQREWPWATPLNLRRAIEHIARRMDRDEDILFIHLTSHGARSGALASSFWPLTTEALTPATLKAALDAAGIRHRIVSISACYSGSWVEPLAGEHTLVMSAADAEHTSFGCGRGSELTYFGRAMYDEQLRSRTLSFEAAHAEARRVIDEREKQAGKDDGYSNPQIRVGESMRLHLRRLEGERGAAQR